MTAKERLTRAADDEVSELSSAAFLDFYVAHPDLLLAVLAESGALTEETHGWELIPTYSKRYVSPWVPSGDQT